MSAASVQMPCMAPVVPRAQDQVAWPPPWHLRLFSRVSSHVGQTHTGKTSNHIMRVQCTSDPAKAQATQGSSPGQRRTCTGAAWNRCLPKRGGSVFSRSARSAASRDRRAADAASSASASAASASRLCRSRRCALSAARAAAVACIARRRGGLDASLRYQQPVK